MNLKCDNNLQSKDENNTKDENFHQVLDLPHDIITQSIITRLPIKSLLKLKSISKQWYSTISSPHFGITHFNFLSNHNSFNHMISSLFIQCGNDYFIYTYDKGLFKLNTGLTICHEFESFVRSPCGSFGELDNDKILIVGSCNGLLCLYSSLGYLIILNPIINQFVKITCPLFEHCKNITWGFGYISSVNDYKVIRMSESNTQHNQILLHIFLLRTREWKRVYDPKIDNYLIRGASTSSGLLIHETLYWIMYRQGDGDYEQDILEFDLVSEKFDIVRNLVPGDSYLGHVRFVCCMGGCLSMSRFTNRGDVSVSVLKENGQVEYIGVYRDLDLGKCCNAFGFTRDGKFFVQLGERELGIVDLNTTPKSYRTVCKFDGDGFIDVKNFVPTLVSPVAVTGM